MKIILSELIQLAVFGLFSTLYSYFNPKSYISFSCISNTSLHMHGYNNLLSTVISAFWFILWIVIFVEYIYGCNLGYADSPL
jgi:hypothetical protein